MRHPLSGEEAFPDRRRRCTRDRGVQGAHAARQHTHRPRRLLFQGLCRGHGDYPVHVERERRPEPDRHGHRVAQPSRPGREDGRYQRAKGLHLQHPGGERGAAPARVHQLHFPGVGVCAVNPED